eukprot:INCI16212.1.p1 GENE.INCI16212.1~~INCI16212.1.p1  ORF type:complete len:653 (+),score=109.76 INCI16212.1:268-2226(+)
MLASRGMLRAVPSAARANPLRWCRTAMCATRSGVTKFPNSGRGLFFLGRERLVQEYPTRLLHSYTRSPATPRISHRMAVGAIGAAIAATGWLVADEVNADGDSEKNMVPGRDMEPAFDMSRFEYAINNQADFASLVKFLKDVHGITLIKLIGVGAASVIFAAKRTVESGAVETVTIKIIDHDLVEPYEIQHQVDMLAAANEILLELWDGSPEGGQIATIQQLYQVIEFVADAQQSHHKSSSFGGTGGRGGGTQYTVLELSYCAGSDLLTVIEQIQLGERDDADFTTAQGGTGGKDHRTAREELVSQLIREGELRGSLGMGLAEEKVKKLVYPLVQTLACLHEDDFTHNDIKPENIMLCRADRSRFDDSDNDHEEVAESGCDQYLALIDFECARHNCLKVDIKEDPPHGTVAYTAPEMILCVLFARFHNLVHRLNEFGENEPDAELSGQRNTADHERTCATTGADDGEDAAGRRGQLLETMECSNSTKSSILSLQAKLEDEYQEFKKANEKLSLRANDCWGLGCLLHIALLGYAPLDKSDDEYTSSDFDQEQEDLQWEFPEEQELAALDTIFLHRQRILEKNSPEADDKTLDDESEPWFAPSEEAGSTPEKIGAWNQLSPEAKALLRGLLELQPSQRLTMVRVLCPTNFPGGR